MSVFICYASLPYMESNVSKVWMNKSHISQMQYNRFALVILILPRLYMLYFSLYWFYFAKYIILNFIWQNFNSYLKRQCLFQRSGRQKALEDPKIRILVWLRCIKTVKPKSTTMAHWLEKIISFLSMNLIYSLRNRYDGNMLVRHS